MTSMTYDPFLLQDLSASGGFEKGYECGPGKAGSASVCRLPDTGGTGVRGARRERIACGWKGFCSGFILTGLTGSFQELSSPSWLWDSA